MAGITLHTARQVVPMIYAYTTPEIARHNGWTKIGYTEQSVDKRLKQQTHTADVLFHEEWRGNAVSQYPVQFLKTSGDPVFLFQTYF